MSEFEPFVAELPSALTPVAAFQQLATQRHCIFFDSARRSDLSQPDSLGRYSFVAADPVAVLSGGDSDALNLMESINGHLIEFATDAVNGLPPFQGGVAGLWSYDLARCFERLPRHHFDEFQMPLLHVGVYDVVLAFDHKTEQGWLVSQGYSECDPEGRKRKAEQRAKHFLSLLDKPVSRVGESAPVTSLKLTDLAPSFETQHAGLYSNFERAAYVDAVQKVIDYIHAGDAFQVNLAQRLICEAKLDSVSLYLQLREKNAAPFAGYYDLGDRQTVSASPERFLRHRNGVVDARPIKGTRQRSPLPEADLFTGAALKASQKDLSENVMIVDLMRNDLSRVCEDDSVEVSKLCGLETFEFVQHLVSVVEGRLRADASPIDLIRATFPGGSITGAPKVRAMEIISELEPTARGAYCGSMGYIGFDGSMDLSILIRTITASHGWWQLPVGGGVVANSEPVAEYEETWHKAEGMLRAIL